MRYLIFCLAILFAADFRAQDFLGYGHSNSAGIVGAAYNPASIADHPQSIDILLCGASIDFQNNYVAIKRSALPEPGKEDLLLRSWNTKKSVFFRNEILLPGVMFSNARYGWGIDLRIRTYANVDGLSKDLAQLLVHELNDPPLYHRELYNRHLGFDMMSWGEIAGSYAKTLYSGAEHFLSAGIRPKFLLGLAAAYVDLNNAGYVFHSDSTVTLYPADLRFAHSDNITFNGGLQPAFGFKFNPGFGIDAGIMYEYRPDQMQDHKGNQFREWPGYRQRPEYKYRIGLSITDLGIIHFRKGELSDHYTVSSQFWDIDDDTFDTTSPAAMQSTFKIRSGGGEAGENLWMRLPLAFNGQFDYHLTKDVYINAATFTALYLRNSNMHRVHELTRISVTPRWERRWLGAWMPVSFTRMGVLNVGAGIKLGPLALGTNDMLWMLFKNKKTFGADAWFVLKVPLFPIGKKAGKKPKLKKGNAPDDCPA